MKDAETGQRGYLLTGDDAYLEPYLAVRDGLKDHLQELRASPCSLMPDNTLTRWHPHRCQTGELALVIELRRKHDMAAVIARVSTDKGKRLMDTIRAEMSLYIQIEDGVQTQREAEFQSDMQRMFAVIVFTSLLVLLFALAFAYLIYRKPGSGCRIWFISRHAICSMCRK